MVEIKLPKYVESILETLNEFGYASYVVGGAVRDALVGNEPKDWDIATDATPDQVEEIFAQTIPTGKKYGTITVVWSSEDGMRDDYCEVTTFRADGNYSDGRRPDEVTFGKNILEDLNRRDFTMNAMAYNTLVGLVDPHNGSGCLKAGILESVGNPLDRFKEDALRVLRAIRFALRYRLDLADGLTRAIKDAIELGLLDNVSRERIHDELTKILQYTQGNKNIVDYAAEPLFEYLFGKVTYKGSVGRILDSKDPIITKLYQLFRLYGKASYEAEIWMREYKYSTADIKEITNFYKLSTLLGTHQNEDKTQDDVEYTCRIMLNKFPLAILNDYMVLLESDSPYKLGIVKNLNQPYRLSDLKLNGDKVKAILSKLDPNYKETDIGTVLNFLMGEVLREPSLNTVQNLTKKVKYLYGQ